MLFRSTLLAMVLFPVLIAGCTETARLPEPQLETAPQLKRVAVVQATQIFSDVCLDTAPDFVAAQSRMKRAGLTDQRKNGTTYDASGTVSAKIQTRSEVGGISVDRCSVVFEDPDTAGALAAATNLMAQSGLSDGPPSKALLGSRSAQIWNVTIEGRPGRVIYVPWRSERLLGGLFLDMPNPRASV